MNFREASSRDWKTGSESGATFEEINSGSLQRIADATEKMAKRYDDLIYDRDLYMKMYKDKRGESESLFRSNAALRGVITKLKKKLKDIELGNTDGN